MVLLVTALLISSAPAGAQVDSDLATLELLAQRQRDISLVIYSLDDPEGGVYHNANFRRPLASTMKILVLAEYAQRVEKHALDPNELVPLDSIDVYYFQGTDGGAHEAAMAALREAGRLQNDELTLAEIANAMIRFSDNASADYLIMRFGRAAMEDIVVQLELEHTDPPVPINGLYVTWVVPFILGEDPLLSADVPEERAWSFGRRLRSARKFPDEVRERMEWMSRRLGYQGQMAAALSFPTGSTRDFAGIMARIYQRTLISEEVSAIMLDFLDWPMDDPETRESFRLFAKKGGFIPGIFTSVYIVAPKPGASGSDPPVSILAMFLEEVPFDMFTEWSTTEANRKLEMRLLLDPNFREAARDILGK